MKGLGMLCLLLAPGWSWGSKAYFEDNSLQVNMAYRSPKTQASASPQHADDVRAAPDLFISSRQSSVYLLKRQIYRSGPMVAMTEAAPEVLAVIDVERVDGGVQTYLINAQFIYDLGTRQRLPFTCAIFIPSWLEIAQKFNCPAPKARGADAWDALP